MYEEIICLEAEIETANIAPKISMIEFWLGKTCKNSFSISLIENQYKCITAIRFVFDNESDLAFFKLSHIYANLINTPHI
jgi:hypothetical protein